MIYIQSNNERTLPHHFDAACAMYGAMDNGLEYRLTTFEEVASGKFDTLIAQHLFVGSVEFMREVFRRVGLKDVRLPANSNRLFELITLGKAHLRVAGGEKLFIKPVDIKLFTGLVLDGTVHSCLTGLPDDTRVIAYEPFRLPILSEWRIYVHNHKAVDAHNYSGDFTVCPDYGYVDEVIRINKNGGLFPVAYTIDIGILGALDNGFPESVVVEFNDMWSIGNYGMQNVFYHRLLRDRYFEIMRQLKESLEQSKRQGW